MLSAEQVRTYQELYHRHFKKELSENAAREQGARLVRLIELICSSTARVECASAPQPHPQPVFRRENVIVKGLQYVVRKAEVFEPA